MSFSIRGRLILLAILIMAAIALMTLSSFSSFEEARMHSPIYNEHIDDKDLLADILPPPGFALEATLVALQYVDSDAERRLALKEELVLRTKEYAASWEKWIKKAEEIGNPTFVQRRSTCRDGGNKVIQQVTSIMASVDGGADDNTRKTATSALMQLYFQHKKEIKVVVDATENRIKERETLISDVEQRAIRNMIGFSVISSVVILIVCWLIGRSIIRPITRTAGQLGAGADQLNNAASEVSTGAQRIAQGASEQAASLEETTASLEELSATCSQNANNARQANALASEATQASESGENAARRATQEVALQMKELATAIEAIRTSTDKTTLVVESIDDIAIQINLLALNAAVEAARAGEAGLGFAVVADEVRNLAARSTEEAKNTSALIREARANTERVHQVSKQVQEYLARTLDQEMVANFQKLVVMVRKVSQLSAEVAAASDEQSRGVGQINAAVAEMDKVTQENAANAEQSAASSEEMQSQVVSVREEVVQLNKIIGLANSAEEQSHVSHENKGNQLRSPSQPSYNGHAKKEQIQHSPQQNNGRTVDRERKPAEMLPLTDEEASEHKGDFSKF
jgi:methyl-accepting chemotaxis protein